MIKIEIRRTTRHDLPAVMDIYARARDFMRKTNNPNQWFDNHPPEAMIKSDIKAGNSYCCVEAGKILAVFYFNVEEEPTYTEINGKWLNDDKYGVIHRIARAEGARGAAAFCMEWCYKQHPNIRIDTHKDNEPMLKLLEKQGYKYCGIIKVANGDERMAYQKTGGE